MGTQNEPRIKLPEGPFVHGCQASKKAQGYELHTFLYWRRTSDKWRGWWPIPPSGHSLWCILRHHMSTSVCDVTAWKCRRKPHHGEDGGCVTKTRGLNYTYATARRSAMIYWGKYHYTCFGVSSEHPLRFHVSWLSPNLKEVQQCLTINIDTKLIENEELFISSWTWNREKHQKFLNQFLTLSYCYFRPHKLLFWFTWQKAISLSMI